VPRSLRATITSLVKAEPNEIVLGNSTSYGLDLLAHGLPLRPGDEVLVVEGDFPASIYPWLPLQRHGVRIRTLPAPSGALEVGTLRKGAERASPSRVHELGVLLHCTHRKCSSSSRSAGSTATSWSFSPAPKPSTLDQPTCVNSAWTP
jgi:Aminotransferase class-V